MRIINKLRPRFVYRMCKRHWKSVVIACALFLVIWIGLSFYFGLTPISFAQNGLRIIAVPVLAQIYSEDEKHAALLRKKYWVGNSGVVNSSSLDSWKHIEKELPGFRFLGGNGSAEKQQHIPFVYESIEAPHLVELRERYNLNEIIMNAADEYDAMLQLGAWIGTRWDHGVDVVPGGITITHPAAIIQAGEAGSKFWCEIAAKVTVNAAAALGWPARTVTASRDGYTWEHGIAELWSNQYNKWFVLDTDFNVVFENKGIPLSAFEICQKAPEFQKKGELHVRAIAPPKPSLPPMNLLPYYKYVHIDLRNDWYSRRLRRGSPTGGDLATWWTARPSFHPVLTAKLNINEQKKFDWPVNFITIFALGIDNLQGAEPILHIGLKGYSPYFKIFQIAIDNSPWVETKNGKYSFPISAGKHSIKARVITMADQVGPLYEVQFQFSSM